MTVQDTEIIIDDEKIDSGDVQDIIGPLWWQVSIYDGEEVYEADLKPFAMEQRYVFALQWYLAEVYNGGHDQFYSNSTGIVWEDARNGAKAAGLDDLHEIIKKSAERMGGYPDKDRENRWKQMDELEPDFDDLDDELYHMEGIEEAIAEYVKNHREAFYFKGIVGIPTY